MNHATIVRAAELWDHETVVREALDWVESPAGASLLRLTPSQLAGLVGSVRGADTAASLISRIESYLSARAGREKRRSHWHDLLSRLPEAMKRAAARATSTEDRANMSFRTCLLLLRREVDPAVVEGIENERQLQVTSAFIAAVARRYRARKLYGAKA